MKKKYVSGLTFLASLAFIILLYPQLQHPATLQAFITRWGPVSIFVDLLIIALLMLFPVIPFVLIAGANTILYGWFSGFLLSLSGSLIGASVGFWLSRTLGQTWAQPRIAKLGKWGTLLQGNSFTVVLFSRLIPVLPSAAVNYASGLSLMTFPSFLLATLIGKSPMIVWESWVGHDIWKISHHPGRLIMALIIGIILFGAVGLYWYFLRKNPRVL